MGDLDDTDTIQECGELKKRGEKNERI